MARAGPTPGQKLAFRLVYGLLVAFLLVLIGLGVWMAVASFQADHHLSAARKALANDRLDEARVHLAAALELRPSSAEVAFLAARTARRAGAIDEAKTHLQRSKDLGWVPEAVSLEEVLLVAQSDPRPFAATLLDWVHRDHPDREEILEALSRGYIHLLDLPKALQCLDDWLTQSPDAIRALHWRGDVHERQGRTEQALRDFQRIVDLDAGHDAARTRLAKLLLKERKLEEAGSHFEVVLQHRPKDVEVLRGLARCRQEENRRAEAEQLLDQALAVNPDDMETLTQKGVLLLEANRLEEAEKVLRQAVDQAPYEREPLFNYSRVLQALGKPQEARPWEERLTQVEADLTVVKKTMSQVLAAPLDPNPRRELGVIFLRNQQDKEALRWLNSALQCDPRHRPTHQTLADYFAKHNQPDLAARHRQLAQ